MGNGFWRHVVYGIVIFLLYWTCLFGDWFPSTAYQLTLAAICLVLIIMLLNRCQDIWSGYGKR